jgi:hypothetical protein
MSNTAKWPGRRILLSWRLADGRGCLTGCQFGHNEVIRRFSRGRLNDDKRKND